MTYTGRVRIPKIIREDFKIEPGDIVFFKKENSGCISMKNEEILDEKYKKMMRNFYWNTEPPEKFFGIEYGFSYIEKDFRVYIEKSFRDFASIDCCRESKKKKVLIILNFFGYVEFWSREVLYRVHGKNVFNVDSGKLSTNERKKFIDKAIDCYTKNMLKKNKKGSFEDTKKIITKLINN